MEVPDLKKVYSIVMLVLVTVAVEITLFCYAYVMKLRSDELFAHDLAQSGRCGMIALVSFFAACAIAALAIWVGKNARRSNARTEYFSRAERARRRRTAKCRRLERLSLTR
jgi:hypothetical protein